MRSRIALRELQAALSAVLPGEDDVQFMKIKQGFRDEFRPRETAEQLLVDQIANLAWRLRRLSEIERRMIEAETRRLAHARPAGCIAIA